MAARTASPPPPPPPPPLLRELTHPIGDHWLGLDDLDLTVRQERIQELEALRAGDGPEIPLDPLALVSILADLGLFRWRLSDPDAALALLDEADTRLAAADRVEPDWSLLRAATLFLSSEIRHTRGEVAEGLAGAREALPLAKQAGDVYLQTLALLLLAEQDRRAGKFLAARAFCREALELCRAAQHRVGEVLVLAQLAYIRLDLRHSDAWDQFVDAEEILKPLQVRRPWMFTRWGMGHTVETSEPRIARDCFRETLEIAEELGDVRWQARCHQGLCVTNWARNNRKATEKEYELSQRLLQQVDDRHYQGIGFLIRAVQVQEMGDLEQRRRLNQEAVARLVHTRSWLRLHTVVGNQALVNDMPQAVLGAQAAWLAAHFRFPPTHTGAACILVFPELGPLSPLAARAIAYAWKVLDNRGGLDAGGDTIRERLLLALTAVLVQRGLAPQPTGGRLRLGDYRPQAIRWLHQMGWTEEEELRRDLLQDLELFVPEDEWWFDYRAIAAEYPETLP